MPVAVDSVRVFELDLDCLWDPETANGPQPTDTFASVFEASSSCSRDWVSPAKLSSTLDAMTKAVGYEGNCSYLASIA